MLKFYHPQKITKVSLMVSAITSFWTIQIWSFQISKFPKYTIVKKLSNSPHQTWFFDKKAAYHVE